MTTYKDMQKKDDKGLTEFVNEKREAVRAFRFGTAGSSTRNVRQVRADKKDIARALTALSARQKDQNANDTK